jgi:predicted nucleic acid-binding protein
LPAVSTFWRQCTEAGRLRVRWAVTRTLGITPAGGDVSSAFFALLDRRDAHHASAVASLMDDILPAVRVEMVDRPLHDASLADLRRFGGGTSLVDRVTLAFAARHGIGRAFAYDADLVAEGLVPVTT